MTPEDHVEFTHAQGLAVGCLGMLFGIGLIYFGAERWFTFGVLAFMTIGGTVFIQRRLLRRPWFLTFVAIMVIGHLAFVLAFPDAALERSEARMLAAADIGGLIALSFGLEKLMSRPK